MWTREFWARTGERSLKTFAQTLALLLGTSSVAPDVFAFAWVPALSMSAGAALLSVLTSAGSGAATGSPSLLGPSVEQPAGRHHDEDGDGRIG